MHLSTEIQRRLDQLGSNVKLASTIEGAFPGKYAFYNKPDRSFRTEFASTDTVFSIVLFERTDKLDYEDCFARGLFTDLERIVSVIDLWVGKQIAISDIQGTFDELEMFQDFEFRNSNIDIDKAWKKIKNMFFNDIEFWRYSDWKLRYFEMLSEAKRHKAFNNYFPFTSHYWLRFSIDKDKNDTWTLDTYIIPTMYSDEVSDLVGKFYVSFNHMPMGGFFFETVKEALDFYAEKLNEVKPIKWVNK